MTERRSDSTNLTAIKAGTQSVYDRNAAGWAATRPTHLFEAPWLNRLAACCPPGGSILDLGCGTGEPIGRYFLDAGLSVTGVDYAPGMIRLANEALPQGDWSVADMRTLNLGRAFDGVISWDGFFHLSVEEQRQSLPAIFDHVAPGGALLMTVGDQEGEVTGTVCEETVYHASLNPDEYEQWCRDAGFRQFEFVAHDESVLARTVCFAWDKAS